MPVTLTELGYPGHCIIAGSCRWRRHTQVGESYRVSTIGEYFPGRDEKRGTLGAAPDSFFESMVFATLPRRDKKNDGCGCLAVASWTELDCQRYATAGEAQKGHEALVRKYRRLAAKA
jgi:hypothetical protein